MSRIKIPPPNVELTATQRKIQELLAARKPVCEIAKTMRLNMEEALEEISRVRLHEHFNNEKKEVEKVANTSKVDKSKEVEQPAEQDKPIEQQKIKVPPAVLDLCRIAVENCTKRAENLKIEMEANAIRQKELSDFLCSVSGDAR